MTTKSDDKEKEPRGKTITVSLSIHGIVQGVFYRSSCKKTAEEYSVKGWVRNRPDGSVEAVLQGEEAAVNSVIEWCRVGPRNANVESIIVSPITSMIEYHSFVVLP